MVRSLECFIDDAQQAGNEDLADGLRQLKQDVEEFVREFVCAYPRGHVRDRKTIHSAPFGGQSLRDYEIALLDTPMIQRLRQIRQTGMAFLTFPTSLHTRFEHTLGTVQRADAVCTVLCEKYPGVGVDWESVRTAVRLAALLHDCGHGPFSHTTEELLHHYPEMRNLRATGSPYEGCKPHEVLGHLILTSDSFRSFFKGLRQEYDVPTDWSLDDIASLVIAKYDRADHFFANQIVNGAMDADKLDYMIRDAFFAGLAASIDVDRLWQGLQLQTFEGRRGLAISLAGLNPVRDIISAKFTLYLSLYKHHKLRACDCMYKGTIEYIQRMNDAGKQPATLFGTNFSRPGHFLQHTDETFFAAALPNPKDGVLHQLIHDIRYRRPLKRALTISRLSLGDHSQAFWQVLNDAWGGGSHGAEIQWRGLAHRIWEDARIDCEPEQVWVDLPDLPHNGDGPNILVNIGTKDKPDLKFYDDIIRAEDFTRDNAYHSWQGHVFCPEEHTAAVAAAAEGVLRQEYKIVLNNYGRLLCHNVESNDD